MLMRFNTKGTQPKARNRATNPAAQHLLVPPPQTRAVHHHPQLLELSVPPASLRAGGVQGEGQHRAHCHELQGVPWGFILSIVIPNFRMPRCRGVQLHTTAPTCRKYFFLQLRWTQRGQNLQDRRPRSPGCEQPGVPTSTAPGTPGTEISLQPPPSHYNSNLARSRRGTGWEAQHWDIRLARKASTHLEHKTTESITYLTGELVISWILARIYGKFRNMK